MSKLKLRPLPHVERVEHFAWREGWWQGIAVGFVIGVCIAVILFRR